MKLSEEMAVRLHRMMWSDMQKELGDRPSGNDRLKFKREWVERNFPGYHIANDCWLCEYASHKVGQGSGDLYCVHCPIKWPNCHCNTLDFSYAKEPISDILALPARNGEKSINDRDLMTLAYCNTKTELAKASGLPEENATTDHIKAIQEKAVEEYFDKTPGAKLATMDVDQAFKQYADEQKAPIFHALAEASGLSAGNKSFKAHISLIKDTAKQNGRLEKSRDLFQALSVYSGVSKDKWSIHDHVEAIMNKVSNEEDMEKLRTANTMLVDQVNKYKDMLSKESDLDRNRPVEDHIREIVRNSMEAGANEERDRIQEKIYEVLLS